MTKGRLWEDSNSKRRPYEERFERGYVGTHMVSVKSLALNVVGDILKTVDPKRQFSETQVSDATSTLNNILSNYALSEEERDTEPTAKKLNKQIDALQSALKRLKLALPKPAQRSLYNYLVHAGEVYAEANGPHPNVERQMVSDWNPEIGEEVSFQLDHFRSDQRLREMIDSVTQVLAWVDHASPMRSADINWLDNTPYWLDEENMFERLEHPYSYFRPVDAHRFRQAELLIGRSLPAVYEKTFEKKFRINRTKDGVGYGAGLRFVMEVLRHAEVTKKGGKELSIETAIKYWSKAQKRLPKKLEPGLYKGG
jgi:hypothetical protein